MSHMRTFVLLGLLVAALVAAAKDKNKDKDQPEGWLPITQQDLAVKDVPNDPGADAIQLYMRYYKDDDANYFSVYHRIKVLRESGKDQADVNIPIDAGQSLKELVARTIHPDQTIVDYTGKPFEKILVKQRGIKETVRTFTFPDVTVGSIIEYRYTVTLPRGVVSPISQWPVQEDIFTVKEDLGFRAYQGVVLTPTEWTNVVRHSQVSYSYLNQIAGDLPHKNPDFSMQLQLQNVPKFDAEEYMPPADDFRPVILFYYGGREMASPDQFWDEWQKLITDYMEKFIGNSRDVKNAAMQAIGNETDPQKKLLKLYARAQQVRNLSWERDRTAQEKKEEHLKRNATAEEVLQHGYGTSRDINLLFTAMVRAVGMDASLLAVSDRKERSFNKIIVWLGQLDLSATLVNLGDKELFLDPGTPFCPFGLMRWRKTATTALKLGKISGGFITTPQPGISLLHRVAHVTLAADGALNGEITVSFKGEDALEYRLDALDEDESGRRKSLEDAVQLWLPQGAVVKLKEAQGWESEDDPLVASFTVNIPGFASAAGKRLLAPAFFFPTLQKNMFTSEFRRYPIAFPYPFTEEDELFMKLPEGYEVEEPPYRRKAGLTYAGYEIASSVEDRELVTRRKLRFAELQLPSDKYEELKNFFSIVQKGDEGHAVLHVGGEQKAQSQN